MRPLIKVHQSTPIYKQKCLKLRHGKCAFGMITSFSIYLCGFSIFVFCAILALRSQSDSCAVRMVDVRQLDRSWCISGRLMRLVRIKTVSLRGDCQSHDLIASDRATSDLPSVFSLSSFPSSLSPSEPDCLSFPDPNFAVHFQIICPWIFVDFYLCACLFSSQVHIHTCSYTITRTYS